MLTFRRSWVIPTILLVFAVARLGMTIVPVVVHKSWITPFLGYWLIETVVCMAAIVFVYWWRPFPYRIAFPLLVLAPLILEAAFEFGYQHYILEQSSSVAGFWGFRLAALHQIGIPALVAASVGLIVYYRECAERAPEQVAGNRRA